MKNTLLLTAALVGLGLLGLPVGSQEADPEDGRQVDVEAADESTDAGTAEEESSDEAPSDDEPVDEAESEDEPTADETESTDEVASGEEEESSDDAVGEDAEQSVEEAVPAEEAAPQAEAQEAAESPAPEPGQSSAAVESWSITLQSPMGARASELRMEKPAGGAAVATISDLASGESRVPVQLSANNLSWAWEVTNPMPMRITCDATIQGEQMAGICTVGMFGKAPVHGSRK